MAPSNSPRLRPLLCLLALLALFAGCEKWSSCRVPIGDATCQIDPNSPLYPGLNIVGGYEYIVGGYSGIVVSRTGMYDFRAYERSCPVDTGRLEMAEGFGNIVLECPKCHARFNTYDCCPLQGSSTSCFIAEYNAYYSGGILYISN